MILRSYQTQAVESILREFEEVGSTLAVLPTGTGKTVVAAEVTKQLLSRSEGSVIFLAHREELLSQARKTIDAHCACQTEIEMGDAHASEIFCADVLLASVQTMIAGRNGTRRMHKFSPYNYGLIIVDEFHHATAASYKAVLDYFKSGNPDIKVLGITATPERSDEEALGQICESIAFDYQILSAIKDGWLVPIQQQLIDIQGLDFSHIKTVAGDLNAGELGAVMEDERNLYGICDATMREIGDRKAIMFTVTVRQAEQACEILNRYRSGVAAFASGKTPKEDRRRIMRDFSEGKFQILVNCNLVSEGFDVPDAQLLIQARPTKSKLLYQQQLGRVMRPLAGCVDGLESAAARKAAISDSKKPIATVMDFVGNAGRHKLIHSTDVLGGKISERTRELIEQQLRKTGQPERVDALVIEAEQREREERQRAETAKRLRLTGRATYSTRVIDPFDCWDLVAPPTRTWDRSKRLTPKQSELLLRQGINSGVMSYSEGKAVLDQLFYRFKNKLATLKQCALLKRRGVTFDPKTITIKQATEMINQIAVREGWNR